MAGNGDVAVPGWRRALWWVAVAAWCAAIYGFSASPTFSGAHTRAVVRSALPPAPPAAVEWANVAVRKAAHLGAFGVLALLVRQAWAPWPYPRRSAWALATLYAVADEWHQTWVPGRTGTWYDVVIDALGAAVALWLAGGRGQPRAAGRGAGR